MSSRPILRRSKRSGKLTTVDDDFTFRAMFKEMWDEMPLLLKIYFVSAFVFGAGFVGVVIWAIIRVVLKFT